MGYAILRTQKLKSKQEIRRSLKHSFRAQETPNADPNRTPENTHIGAEDTLDALQKIDARLPEKIRKNGVLVIEYLITASPEDMQGKTRLQQDAYFSDARQWLQDRHGTENVVYAGIHRDETTPHMYAYVVPIDSKGKLNCRAFLGGAKALSEMQTDFADRVGKKHRLERGIEGSKARHTKVRAFYGAIEHTPHKHAHFSATQVEPKLLSQNFLAKTYENANDQAERLSNIVKNHYEPAIKEASVSRLERIKRQQAEKTAERMRSTLKSTENKLQHYQEVFLGLTEEQIKLLTSNAQELRRQNAISEEKQHRIEAIPALNRTASGPQKTFARYAMEALAAQDDDGSKVDWHEVNQKAGTESVREHGQPKRLVMEALLKHSPQYAGKTPEEATQMLKEAEEWDKQHPWKEKERSKTRGLER
jgi:rRNA-processing protein FCF1